MIKPLGKTKVVVCGILLAFACTNKPTRETDSRPTILSAEWASEIDEEEDCDANRDFGHFPDPLRLEFISSSKNDAYLTENFRFIDKQGRTWTAPRSNENKLWRWNGSSIPWLFTRFFGTPMQGCHRLASVLHDYHYQRANDHLWSRLHIDSLYYEGLLANGVDIPRAKLMFFMLDAFGSFAWQRDEDAHPSTPSSPLEDLESEAKMAVVQLVAQVIARDNPTIEELHELAIHPGALVGGGSQ